MVNEPAVGAAQSVGQRVSLVGVGRSDRAADVSARHRILGHAPSGARALREYRWVVEDNVDGHRNPRPGCPITGNDRHGVRALVQRDARQREELAVCRVYSERRRVRALEGVVQRGARIGVSRRHRLPDGRPSRCATGHAPCRARALGETRADCSAAQSWPRSLP